MLRNEESAAGQAGTITRTRSETALLKTAQLNSTRLPNSITDDPRWRAVWRRLLMPVEVGKGAGDESP